MNRAALTLSSSARSWLRIHDYRFGLPIAGLYFLAYVLVDALSYVQPVLRLDICPWNPETALTLAFLLAVGPRGLPLTALAAFTAEGLVHGMPAPWWALLVASVWIACGYTALALIMRRWGLPHPIESPAQAMRLAGAVMLTSFAVAVGYVTLVTLGGALPRSLAIGAIARYWVGDVIGILTLVPLLMYADRWRSGLRALRRGLPIAALQLGVVALTMWLIFGLNQSDQVRFFYLLFVPVIWITLRWGVPGAILSALAIQIGVIIAVQHDMHAPELVDLQFLLLTLSLTALLLGAVVTQRADALQRVATSEAEQRALLATAPDAVLTVSSRGWLCSANPEAQRLFGIDPLIGRERALQDLLPSFELLSAHGRAAIDGRRIDGSGFPAEIAWARLEAPATAEYLVIVRDVTERRRAEVQLRERERALSDAMRFAVAGELASALAHELNQPITALVSYLQACGILAAPLAAQDTRLALTLGKATHEAHRAAEVLRRLRDFYRNGAIKREPVQLSALCRAIVTAFHERLQCNAITLAVKLPAVLPSLQSDVTQLEIILHNLLANAIDAVCQQPVDRRRIELSVDSSTTAVMVRVRDAGPGIAAEVAHKLFEPFVTTKMDGMGLGLAISRSLLRAQGGDLLYEPDASDAGACFIVHLPLDPKAQARKVARIMSCGEAT
ncbi:MAG TPA: MASE1 domain-containing protein [Steroidobacteraceae bacterium]|jgi:PAS domain S-box-containing protein|nr:MASE1 domain-containing protein [Steroidobacteraceae bacterium]